MSSDQKQERRNGRERRIDELSDPIKSVKKNSTRTRGAPNISPVELELAFRFFDDTGKGYIEMKDLKDKLEVFYDAQPSEYRFLMDNKTRLTPKDLMQMLSFNDMSGFDPVAEAFKVYDPDGKGHIDEQLFGRILAKLRFDDVTDQDVKTLIETADLDGDGVVSLEDFRGMLPEALGPHDTGYDQDDGYADEHGDVYDDYGEGYEEEGGEEHAGHEEQH